MPKFIKWIFFNFVALVTLVCSLELLCHTLYYLHAKRWHFWAVPADRNDTLFEDHPYLARRLRGGADVGMFRSKNHINRDHTRFIPGTVSDAPRLRVACIGGSTTYCTHVDDALAWPALLQEALGPEVEVINFGVPGYASLEHIAQMAMIVPEYDPDLVVFYAGWNDLSFYHTPDMGPDYQARRSDYATDPTAFESLRDHIYPKLVKVSATIKLIEGLKRRAGFYDIPASQYKTDPDPHLDRLYRRNLNTLQVLSDHFEIQAVFVPQILNNTKFLEADKPPGYMKRLDPKTVPKLIDHINGGTEAVCAQEGFNGAFHGGMRDLEWLPSDFEDWGHFSEEGNRKFSAALTAFLRDEFPDWFMRTSRPEHDALH